MKTKRYRTSPKTSSVTRSYEGTLDSKKRIVIRGARHKHYLIREEANGAIHLTPQERIEIESIPPRVMAQIERSMKNLEKGKVYGPIDLSGFRKHRRKRAK